MDKKTTRAWIAAEFGSSVVMFAMAVFLDNKYYGYVVLGIAVWAFVFAVADGLRSRR
jgi:hypothetical protein